MHLDVRLSGEGNYGVNLYRLILLQYPSQCTDVAGILIGNATCKCTKNSRE